MAKTGFRGGRGEASTQENIELLTGQRGNGLDRAITVRDLANTKLVNVSRSRSGNYEIKPNPSDGDNTTAYPTTPNGFEVAGGFSSIMLRWDTPKYVGHAYTEVWRATTQIFNNASLIATTPATVFGDIVPTGSTFYYWIRHVNNKNHPGAFNSTLGTIGKTSPDISAIIDDIGNQMRKSELIQDLTTDIDQVGARVDTHEQAIETIDKDGSKAFKALWSKKVSASGITAGIGLIAKSDGTSQVAISASQFFVFDPNKPGNLTPALAIDDGKVIIPQALIENATIQIIQAQEITADHVRAGISIETPTLTSAVINGAELNIGAGGTYNGFHTKITADGIIYTDYLVASGGTLDNITIKENCKIYGTLYGVDGTFSGTIEANQIVGDLLKGTVLRLENTASGGDTLHNKSGYLQSYGSMTFLAFNIQADTENRWLKFDSDWYIETNGAGGVFRVRTYLDDRMIGESGWSERYYVRDLFALIPANLSGRVEIRAVSLTSGSLPYTSYSYTLSVVVMMFREATDIKQV